METSFDLTAYLNKGIENLVADILRSTLRNPKETAFLVKYKELLKKQKRKKTEREEEGLNIPAFLISSITSDCNLYCKGCYARANGLCGSQSKEEQLSAAEWRDIFEQASELGVSFNLLAGGEPLLRRDVIETAAEIPEIIFPVFTNGTLIDEQYLKLYDAHRNIVPILSIEGKRQQTDLRRGAGTYDQLLEIMGSMQKRKILFGSSVTVTVENLEEVTSKAFLDVLHELGCRLIFFIEYVPVDSSTKHLAPGDRERLLLEERQKHLRKAYNNMVFLSFPGDEKYMGGCLAAGRGFFHINPYGAAEACPFSPYSDRSLKEHTLVEVLGSPLFKKLRDSNLTGDAHVGGCALFEQDDQVRALLDL